MDKSTLNQVILASNLNNILKDVDCSECFLYNDCITIGKSICDKVDEILEKECDAVIDSIEEVVEDKQLSDASKIRAIKGILNDYSVPF